MAETKLFLNEVKGKQKEILLSFKKELNVSWNKLAEIVNKSRSMVFHYNNDKHKMPLEVIEKLCVKTTGNFKKFEKLKVIKNYKFLPKKIIKPKLNEDLAEFLGALSGDGCIGNYGNAVEITCSRLVDKNYIETRILKLFKKLFGLNKKTSVKKNVIYVRSYCKELSEFLNKDFGFPKGHKKNQLKIPPEIKKKPKFLKKFLAGLFDTDGSFYGHHPNTGAVAFISASKKFLEEVFEALKSLNFKCCISGKSVYIYDKNEIDKFFKEIKPKNLKHLLKYRIFKETKKVPSHKEIIEILNNAAAVV